MGRRALLLLASILVAAAGTALIWVYVQGADSRAQSAEQTVPVLMATGSIEIGTPGGALATTGLVAVAQVPKRLVPWDAVGNLAQLGGQSAVAPISKGQFLVRSQFLPAGGTQGITKGNVAVEVTVADPNRVAGLLHPDMDVVVYYLPPSGGTARGGAAAAGSSVKVLMTTAHVIGVGNTTVVRNARGLPAQVGTQSGVAASVVTLDVASKDAQRIILASINGTLWFAALGDGTKVNLNDTVTPNEL